MFWIIFSIVLLVAAVVCLVLYLHDSYEYEWMLIVVILGFVTGLLVLLAACCTRADAFAFIRSMEIQREYLAMMQEANPELNSNVLYVADILDANQELAEMIATKERYGFFSVIPNEIFDVLPLGVS